MRKKSESTRTLEEGVEVDVGVGLLELALDVVQLGHGVLLHDGQHHAGGVLRAVVQHVVGHVDGAGGAVLDQQLAVVEVHAEAGGVRAGHCEAQCVSRSDGVRGVPQTGGDLVDLAGLHVHGREAALSPAHAHGAVLDQAHLAGRVDIGDAHL